MTEVATALGGWILACLGVVTIMASIVLGIRLGTLFFELLTGRQK